MKCLLKILKGPASGGSIPIESGETVSVGRNHNASFVIGEDPLLSALHFAVRCDSDGCTLQDLGSTNKTFVNDACVSRAQLRHGDVVQAGTSGFEVSLIESDEPQAATEAGARESKGTVVGRLAAPAYDEPVSGFVAPYAAGVISRFGLTDDAYKAVDAKWPGDDLVRHLQQNQKLVDALRFLAYALPKRCAVWWACQCVRHAGGNEMKPADETALVAAETWVRTPTDENRRAAMAEAEKQGHGTAACWACVGAFWSNGSMAPPTAPVVPPGDDLTGKAIFGAVQLGAVARQPEKGAEKHDAFIKIALEISRGANTWKQPDSPGK